MQSVSYKLAALIFVVCASSVQAETTIAVRSDAVVERAVVRLADIAAISSDDDAEVRRLGALPLMPTPSAGNKRFLRKREVEDMLAAHDIDFKTVTLVGADQVAVSAKPEVRTTNFVEPGASPAKSVGNSGPFDRRAALSAGHITMGTKAPQAEKSKVDYSVLETGVRELVTSYVATKLPRVRECEITCKVSDRHLESLTEAISRPICSGGTAPWTGRQRFEITFDTSSGGKRFSVNADITPPPMPVVVAVRAVARGNVITAADVAVQEVSNLPRASERRTPLQSVEPIIGQEAKQTLTAGSIVYSDSVQAPIVVKRGDLITVSSQGSGIRVRTTVRALHDCARGELVQVESLQTKQRFDARVTGIREATIAAVTTSPRTVQAPVSTAHRR